MVAFAYLVAEMNMTVEREDRERTTVMKLTTSTRARLQIVKNQLRLRSAEQTMVRLLDFWEKNGGSGRDGGVRD
jgi:hypothetical protein